MYWVNHKPIKPGLYWFARYQKLDEHNDYGVVEVKMHHGALSVVGPTYYVSVATFPAKLWAGPIEMPEKAPVGTCPQFEGTPPMRAKELIHHLVRLGAAGKVRDVQLLAVQEMRRRKLAKDTEGRAELYEALKASGYDFRQAVLRDDER